MYSDNYNNKNDKMKKNDIHFQFTGFYYKYCVIS